VLSTTKLQSLCEHFRKTGTANRVGSRHVVVADAPKDQRCARYIEQCITGPRVAIAGLTKRSHDPQMPAVADQVNLHARLGLKMYRLFAMRFNIQGLIMDMAAENPANRRVEANTA
jgi:hypothetical protein